MSVLTDPSVRQSVARCGVNLTAQMEQKKLVERMLVAAVEECFQARTEQEYQQWNEARIELAEKIKAMGRGN